MDETIQSGVIADVKKAFAMLSNAVSKGVKALENYGVEIPTDIQKVLESDKWPKDIEFHTTSGNTVKLYIERTEDSDDRCNIAMYVKETGKGFKRANTLIDDLEDIIKDNLDKLGLSVKSSVRIHLRKVTAADETAVELTYVDPESVHDAAQAWDAIAHVIDDDAFVDQLPEGEEVSYAISEGDDAYDIESYSDGELHDVEHASFCAVLQAAYCALFDLQWIHWNIRGPEFQALHEYAGQAIYDIQEYIDKLAEWSVERCGSAPHPSTLIDTQCCPGCGCPDSDIQASGEDLKEVINDWIATLNLYYSNFPRDIQSDIDSHILVMSKIANFFVASTNF